jgi:hypothetical protein
MLWRRKVTLIVLLHASARMGHHQGKHVNEEYKLLNYTLKVIALHQLTYSGI